MYDFKELNNLIMVDVVEKLGYEVKTSGRNKVMLCPFHEDHNPSMVVYEHFAKCYACGKGLGVINFVKEDKGISTKEACEWLSEQFRPSLPHPLLALRRTRHCSPLTSAERDIQSLSKGLVRPIIGRGGRHPEQSERKTKKTPTLHKLQNIIDRSTNCISHPSPNHGGEGQGVRGSSHNCISHPSPNHGGEGMGVRGSDGPSSYVFDFDYVAKHLSVENSFCKCLRKLFNSETVFYVTDMYGIGSFNIDDTMFPIIDKDLRVHNIKIQHYDTNPLSETFFHKDRGKAWWYGVKYLETHKDAQGIYDVKCYFGEHLISRFPSAIIVLVESPKNAILGACVWPEYLWVAAGNKGMLNRERLECMRGRKVLVMPDCDAVEEWRSLLSTMQDIATFVISDMVEEFRKIGPKADVGDWVVKKYFKLSEVR